jgi:hypothetical protein
MRSRCSRGHRRLGVPAPLPLCSRLFRCSAAGATSRFSTNPHLRTKSPPVRQRLLHPDEDWENHRPEIEIRNGTLILSLLIYLLFSIYYLLIYYL